MNAVRGSSLTGLRHFFFIQVILSGTGYGLAHGVLRMRVRATDNGLENPTNKVIVIAHACIRYAGVVGRGRQITGYHDDLYRICP